MNRIFQLRYEELRTLAKNFNNEGEDISLLYSQTRQKVHDLHAEWVGEAADQFYEEMETEVLPALYREAQALFFAHKVLLLVIKKYQEADNEAAQRFHRFGRLEPSLTRDFGSPFSSISAGPAKSDFFSNGSGGQSNFQPDISGSAGQATAGSDATGTGSGQSDQQGSSGTAGAQGTSGAGSGSSGGGVSAGGSGDLNGMGSGIGGTSGTGVPGIGGSATVNPDMPPDHIYQSGAVNAADGLKTGNAGGAVGDQGQQQSNGTEASVASAAVMGAAGLGGAFKAARDRKNKKSNI